MVNFFDSIKIRLNKIKYFILFDFFKLKQTKLIKHKNVKLKFLITNDITEYRAKTFSTKEPKTLNWIENFEKHKCFWDVGANIGLYSIYSKLINKSLQVCSFEPSFKNLNILYENLHLNNLNKEIIIFPIPLSNNEEITNFIIGDDVDGGANSTLVNDSNFLKKTSNVSYKTSSFSIDKLVKNFNLPSPNYIKIDVDGNEIQILEGIGDQFKSLKEILIEVDDFENNIKFVEDYLIKKNFFIYDIEYFGKNNKTANFIFKKNEK